MAESKYKVTKPNYTVYVRKGPGPSYAEVTVLNGANNKTYTATETKNGWIHLKSPNGWSPLRDRNGMTVMTKISTNSLKPVDAPKKEEKKRKEVNEESYAYVPTDPVITTTGAEFDSNLDRNLVISNLRGIFGMPYQFMQSVDPRIGNTNNSDSIGRKYAKEIVATMPLLLMTAGKPVFMGGYSTKDKKTILGQFINLASGVDTDIQNMIFGKDFGKYYSLEYAWNEYFEYVNPMCRIAARTMNLHNVEIDGVKLDEINWAKQSNTNFSKLFTVYNGCTAWYCDSDTSINENFGNNTTESMIASKINSLSDYGRELNFLLGTVKSETGVALDKFTSVENLNTNMEKVNEMINNALGNNGISGVFSSITNSAQTVISGGKLVFPEIWESSNFSRSFTVNLKFVSPDGDDLSVYLNIIVPMLHLLGLVLPREAAKSHGYISPFLVRAFYKGLFNVDMGIITDLSFTKGKESAWTASGIPTVVEASFTIKDLYDDMYLTSMKSMKRNMMNNIILMDYIGNLCGVNINEVDIRRAIDLFFTQNIKNRITDTWHMKIWGRLENWVSNEWQKLFGKF